MPVDIVFGTQYGDEGKGRIVDSIADQYNYVVRYQGGANAGHTICIGDAKHVLHLVPSAIFKEKPICVIGAGTVICLKTLLEEVEMLNNLGIDTGRIKISSRAHVVLPTHKLIEEQYSDRIGTTKRGIGSTYADKHHRIGVRFGDLGSACNITDALNAQNYMYSALNGMAIRGVREAVMWYYEKLKHLQLDNHGLLESENSWGARILLEGAQGYELDIDNGDYPFVTSSNIHPGYALASLGLPVQSLREVIGVTKAYTTRVGEGPFPTELHGDVADSYREHGREYGATTGRPRRCGWLDTDAIFRVGSAVGVTKWALTKLDIPPLVGEFKVQNGTLREYDLWPAGDLGEPGNWNGNLGLFLDDMEDTLESKISMLSYGPERDSIIHM